jgi:hypothetical protein
VLSQNAIERWVPEARAGTRPFVPTGGTKVPDPVGPARRLFPTTPGLHLGAAHSGRAPFLLRADHAVNQLTIRAWLTLACGQSAQTTKYPVQAQKKVSQCRITSRDSLPSW